MLRTVIYIRKSSDEKSEKQALSLSRQRGDILDFIDRHNSSVPEHDRLIFNPERDIIEEEFSAKKPGRPKFNAMIESIKQKRYDVLLSHEPSRLSRNPIDTGILTHMLDEKYLPQIRTMTNIFNNTPADKFTLSLLLTVSKFENDTRGSNTSSGMQSQKKAGNTTNIANMGYMNTGEIKGMKRVEPDGTNFTILRKCWEMLLSEKYKVSEIYEYATKQGLNYITSMKGGNIVRATPQCGALREAFKNPFYTGKVPYGKDENRIYVPGKHTPMVTDEEFEKAQIILQKRGIKHSKYIKPKYENLLESILQCGKTGKPFYVDLKVRYNCLGCKGRFFSKEPPTECKKCHGQYPLKDYRIEHYKYFATRGEKHKYDPNKAPASNIPIDYIEKGIDKILGTITITDKLYSVMRRKLYTLWTEKETFTNKQIATIRKEIRTLEKKKRTMVENGFGQENVSEGIMVALEESEKDISQQIRQKQSDILQIQEENSMDFEIAWQGLNTLLEAKKVFGKGAPESFEPKRHLLVSVFSNLKVLDEKIIPEWQEPFATIAKARELTKQKSYSACRIPEISCVWLPELDSNQWPTG